MRKSVLFMLVASTLLVSTTRNADAQEQKDPIDQKLTACLGSSTGSSTVGQEDCAAKAAAAWDSELNQVYQKLLKTLDPASQALLQASQRQWLAFRDAEAKFQHSWGRGQGTSAGVTVSLTNADILRSRVMTLRNYSGGGNPN